jgi:hypothetical protein
MSLHALEILAGRAYNEHGQVAVLVSHGYGAGWYTWHHVEALLYDPVVVHMVLNKASADDIVSYCDKTHGSQHYYGGTEGLVVHWLPRGARFQIDEFDGAESLRLESEQQWFVA